MPLESYERGMWRDRLEPWTYFVGTTSYLELHPDTEPAAIAEAQRQVVRPLARLTVKKISNRVHLPVSVVRRRLVEMGYSPKE